MSVTFEIQTAMSNKKLLRQISKDKLVSKEDIKQKEINLLKEGLENILKHHKIVHGTGLVETMCTTCLIASNTLSKLDRDNN